MATINDSTAALDIDDIDDSGEWKIVVNSVGTKEWERIDNSQLAPAAASLTDVKSQTFTATGVLAQDSILTLSSNVTDPDSVEVTVQGAGPQVNGIDFQVGAGNPYVNLATALVNLLVNGDTIHVQYI